MRLRDQITRLRDVENTITMLERGRRDATNDVLALLSDTETP